MAIHDLDASAVTLARLLPDGSRDPSFSGPSVAMQTLNDYEQAFDPVTGQLVYLTVVHAVSPLFETLDRAPDGTIVTAGRLVPNEPIRPPQVWKLLPGGQRDPNFDTGEGATCSNGVVASIRRVRVAPDGKIWVLGQFDRYNGVAVNGIVRLGPNGVVDATARFPVNWVDFGATTADVGFELDGQVYLTGAFAQPGERMPFAVTKLRGAALVPLPTATPAPIPTPSPTPTVTPTPTATPTPTPTPTATPTPTPGPVHLINVATRLRAGAGNNVPIAGFAIGGGSRKVIIRALGPSLSGFGVSNALADPTLELRDSAQNLIATNDDFSTLGASLADLQAAGLTPSHAKESALVQTLTEGTYTAIVRGKDGKVGNCLVEVYESTHGDARLLNLSTRGQVGTDDSVMIAGLVVGGTVPKRFLIRAAGPSLAQFGVSEVLADPTIQINAGQSVIAENDNWASSNAAEISATGLAPQDPLESAVVLTLAPGSYTAIVRGKDGTTGNAIVEVYELP